MSDLPILDNSKPTLRKTALARRQSLPMTAISRNITQHLIVWPTFQKSEIVLFFYPFRNEVDLSSLPKEFPGKQWYLPKVETGQQMGFYRYIPDAPLIPGPYHVLEPVSTEPLVFSEHSDILILVPGLMFDQLGHRLGYGKGYYDRFLSGLKAKNVHFTAIGPVPDALWIDALPHESNDIPVHAVVSESRLVIIPKGV